MFDLKTFKELARIPAAEDADAILYDAPSNRVFSLNGDAHSSTVDRRRVRKARHERSSRRQAGYGASAGDGKVYANLTDTSEVVEIDAKTATVSRRWSTAAASSLCRWRSIRRTIACSAAAAAASWRSPTIRRQADHDASDRDGGRRRWLRPGHGDVFATNADGTLTVIHQDSADMYHVVGNLTTPMGSRNMGLDPATHRIFVASAMFAAPPPRAGARQAAAAARRWCRGRSRYW